jgi:hypothetical protein
MRRRGTREADARSPWGSCGIRVMSGHRAVSPELSTVSDGRSGLRHACATSLWSHRMAASWRTPVAARLAAWGEGKHTRINRPAVVCPPRTSFAGVWRPGCARLPPTPLAAVSPVSMARRRPRVVAACPSCPNSPTPRQFCRPPPGRSRCPTTAPALCVGARPISGPRCVPTDVKRVTTLSPSATWSSMMSWKSGKACRNSYTKAFTAAMPRTSWGPAAWLCWWLTKSAAYSSSTAASRPWLQTSSITRRTNALFCSTVTGVPPGSAGRARARWSLRLHMAVSHSVETVRGYTRQV